MHYVSVANVVCGDGNWSEGHTHMVMPPANTQGKVACCNAQLGDYKLLLCACVCSHQTPLVRVCT